MSQTSNIEWTEATWNPLAGCAEVSPGCTNCYAAVMAHRLEAMGQAKYKGTTRKAASGKVVWTGKINLDENALQEPLRKKKPTTYFVNSMSDLFHEDVPDEFIDKVFAVMALAKHHTFQVLTKRAERMAQYFAVPGVEDRIDDIACGMRDDVKHWTDFAVDYIRLGRGGFVGLPLDNVWLGVSVEDQKRADERIPYLLKTPAAVRFLSCEPLLGTVDLNRVLTKEDGQDLRIDCLTGEWWYAHTHNEFTPAPVGDINWVIVGGESGPGARPMHPDWPRSIREQCVTAGVPFFFKQWGEFAPLGEASGLDPDHHYPGRDKRVSVHSGVPMDEPTSMFPVGKKSAGRLLDGREWNEMPVKATVPQ